MRARASLRSVVAGATVGCAFMALRDGVAEGQATQESPADIAVRDEPGETTVRLDHHDDLATVLGDGLEGLPDRGGRGHDQRWIHGHVIITALIIRNFEDLGKFPG